MLTSFPLRALVGATLAVSSIWQASAQSNSATEGEEEVFELKAFTVHSAAQSLALEAKRQNDRIGSFLSSDAIGVLPDDDLGDALSRLAGVNVVDGGVVIRGAEGELNNIQIDGFSPSDVSTNLSLDYGEADTRQFETDQIPTELVDSVEVIKSITADLDGDSVGGLVNVKTADSFRYDEPFKYFKAEHRYNELEGQTGYGFSTTYADRINDEGTMGIYFNASLRNDNRVTSSMSIDFEPGGPDLDENGDPQNVRRIRRIRPRGEWQEREELNLNGSFDWKVSEATTVHFKGWYSRDQRDRLTNEVRLDEGDESWKDFDDRNIGDVRRIDAERYLDGLQIDPVTNELVSIGNFLNNNAPGTLTPAPADASNYRQVEEFRPIRLLKNENPVEERFRLMFTGETELADGGFLEYGLAYEESEMDSFRLEGSFEAEAQEDTRIFRAFWDGSDPLRPNVTAILKDVPLGSGQALDDNASDSPSERIAEWIADGYSEADAQRMLAAGQTGENAPAAVDSDGSPVYWWEVQDQSNIQILDLISRSNYVRTNEQLTARLDYTKPMSERFKLKMGAKVRQQQRVTSADSKQWSQDEGVVIDEYGSVFTILDFQNLGTNFPPVSINDGMYQQAAGKFIDPLSLAQFQNDNFVDSQGRPMWSPSTPDSLRRIAGKNWEGEETVAAGYLMGTWKPTADLTFIAGGRYEHTWNDFTWKASDVDPPLPFDPITEELISDVVLPRVADESVEKEYGNFLPSGVAVYRKGNHVFRAAASQTVARPDFDDLNPINIYALFEAWGEFFGDPDNDIYIYNPLLEEQTSNNYDLAWEWYPSDGTHFSVSLFRKDLKAFHLDQEVEREDVAYPVLDPDTGLQETDANGNPLFDFEDQEIKFAGNGSDRTLEGVELSYNQSFRDILPGPLDGLGTLINYTYLRGEETNSIFDPDALLEGRFVTVGERVSDGLTGQPKHIVNAQLFWEKWGVSTRLEYNYVSDLDTDVFTPGSNEIEMSRGQVDASIQYLLPEKWVGDKRIRVFLQGRNLNREGEREYDQIPFWTTSIETPQREFIAGVRGQF
ncbi:TonB-dependent receptor [Pelagicoccus enzymogenes]|uniref:TonB-dependent receptor n=1 Tax=Pelagicoccus enzymogenes TaxID=2773457 RepID=UPI00280C76E3|nr:TonB-dependent receptor [Pelagicoccus enzymogenes]MDQ8199417.1 TonB-dependent receptor [Pelagicoccus enzymogenes]